MHVHPVFILVEARDRSARVVAGFGQGRAHQPVQLVPGHRELRHRVLAEDGPVLVQCDAAHDRHADGLVGGRARLRQSIEQLGVGHDARAAARERLAGALEHVDGKAQAVQQRAREQPGDRPARHDHPSASGGTC